MELGTTRLPMEILKLRHATKNAKILPASCSRNSVDVFVGARAPIL